MKIQLSYQNADPMWGENALLTFNDQGAVIHLNENGDSQETKLKVQRAARKLRDQGVKNGELVGEEWNLASCWAFYQGFYSAKQDYELILPELDEESQDALLSRILCGDFVREITNLSADIITPEALAENAAKFITDIAADYAPEEAVIAYDIITGDELLEEGFNGIWSVGKGSSNPPAMLQLDYNPTGDENAPVLACLVGKGITFDSGGYSIKPTNSMVNMRTDMGGAALLTGALAQAIANGLQERVKLVLCCAENMVSANAMKLGDVITYSNGVSVEVRNTDAEGRLVLADGLIWACQQQPALIIDAATLTGAAKAAVGNDYHSVLSLDDTLTAALFDAAEDTGEPFWRLPFAELHRGQVKSDFADISNTAAVATPAGASTAAAFLSYFVEEYANGWLHLDLSASFRPAASDLWGVGATGIGVQTIANLLLSLEY